MPEFVVFVVEPSWLFLASMVVFAWSLVWTLIAAWRRAKDAGSIKAAVWSDGYQLGVMDERIAADFGAPYREPDRTNPYREGK